MTHSFNLFASLYDVKNSNVKKNSCLSVKPIDKEIVLKSVEKTGKLVIADGGWKTCGFAAEISAMIAEEGFGFLKAPVKRVTLPDIPAPASRTLEEAYYPTEADIVEAVKSVF